MKIDAAMLSLRLPENAHLRLQDAQGASVRVHRGVLWITQAGDGVDHLIEPGCSFTLDRKGATIISAITDAELQIENSSWRGGDTIMSRLLASVGLEIPAGGPIERRLTAALMRCEAGHAKSI